MSARKMAKIAILSALCVAFRYALSFLPNVQPISAIFFLIVIFEDLPTSLLVMAVTMFTSAFLFGNESNRPLSVAVLWTDSLPLATALSSLKSSGTGNSSSSSILWLWHCHRYTDSLALQLSLVVLCDYQRFDLQYSARTVDFVFLPTLVPYFKEAL